MTSNNRSQGAMEAMIIIIKIQKKVNSFPLPLPAASPIMDSCCLKNHSFDCDSPGSAEQAKKTLEKAIDHLGMTLGN
jgi:hypothetical protein